MYLLLCDWVAEGKMTRKDSDTLNPARDSEIRIDEKVESPHIVEKYDTFGVLDTIQSMLAAH